MSQYPGAPNAYPSAPNVGFQPYAQPAMNPQVVVQAQLGDTSIRMICPNCRHEIMTQTSTECSLIQHAAFFIMCITGVCLICSCVPYCIDSLGRTRHECPNCHTHLGSSK